MKIKFVVAGMLLCASVMQSHAQAETKPLTRKGHFILGTTVLGLSASNATGIETQGSSNDSSHYKATSVSTSLYVWAGYFVSDRVCWGFSMNTETNPNIGEFVYPNTVYSTFFRYYFNKPDTTGFDFFAEGNVGAGYSSFNSTNNQESGYTNGPETNTGLSINTNVGLCAAYNFTKHWGIEAMVGLSLGITDDKNGSYTSTGLYYNSSTGTSSVQTNTMPAVTSKYFTNAETLSLRLHFYM